jgi:hypothetical protein
VKKGAQGAIKVETPINRAFDLLLEVWIALLGLDIMVVQSSNQPSGIGVQHPSLTHVAEILH